MRITTTTLIACLALIPLAHAQESYWPVTRESNGAQLTTYQPQVEGWADYAEITFRQAFALITKKGEPELLGVIRARALTDVDMTSHSVLVHDVEVLYVHFPSLDSATSAGLTPVVTGFFPDSLGLSLEQVVASVPKETAVKPSAVAHDPPDIFVSFGPALLLQVEKTAMSSDIPETSLSYVLNASWPVFFDKKGNAYYLWDEQEWLTADKLDGTWQITTKLPAEMNDLAKDTLWSSFKEAIPAPKPTTKNKKGPRVFFSSKPAELVLFDGEPKWQKIPDNTLVYAGNTSHDVFKEAKTGKYYILVGGRWYRTTDLDANKWTYASDDLPADFGRIPYSSPASRVLASVPGTEAAKDAVLIAQIPTRIVIDPDEAAKEVKVTYDGEPRFEPIEGTSLTYAVNTADKVVNLDGTYYVCYQGIWFLSTSPTGPWTTARTIPAEIYTIPASSPVYNITFVTQEETEDGNVEASYTSGYTGSYVSGAGASVVVVFGTGYYYPPYYYHPPYGYPYYYAYPPPFGYPYYGYGNTYYRSSYNPYTGTYGRSATTYGPYGSATVGQAYNPYTGTSARGVSTTTPYGRNSYAEAYNPYTRTYARTEQHSNYNGQWGSSTISNSRGTVQTGHAVSDEGAIAGARSSSGAAAVKVAGEGGTGGAIRTQGGDVYAGSDGNVYKKTDSGWTQVGGPSASTTQTMQAKGVRTQPAARQQGTTASQPKVSSAQTQELNKQSYDRSRSNYSSQQYSSSRAASSSYSRPTTTSRPSGGGMRRR